MIEALNYKDEIKHHSVLNKFRCVEDDNLLLKVSNANVEVLNNFLNRNVKKISYINFVLNSSNNLKDILNILKPNINIDCVIIFDALNEGETNANILKEFNYFSRENNVDYDHVDSSGETLYKTNNEEETILIIHSINVTYKYVFARFNEDISWFTHDKNIMDNALVYNKGLPLNIENEIFLKNVGRDPGTFFQFIIDNYDNLPDVCIFSQGRLDDTLIQGKLGDINTLKKLKRQAILYGESPYVEIIGDKLWGNDWNFHLGGWGYDETHYKNQKVISCIDWTNIHVNKNVKNLSRFHPCCIFSVSKEKILRRTKKYYENLLEEVNWHNQGMEQTFVERTLYYIFNPNEIY